jgi:hypothetical protein
MPTRAENNHMENAACIQEWNDNLGALQHVGIVLADVEKNARPDIFGNHGQPGADGIFLPERRTVAENPRAGKEIRMPEREMIRYRSAVRSARRRPEVALPGNRLMLLEIRENGSIDDASIQIVESIGCADDHEGRDLSVQNRLIRHFIHAGIEPIVTGSAETRQEIENGVGLLGLRIIAGR